MGFLLPTDGKIKDPIHTSWFHVHYPPADWAGTPCQPDSGPGVLY
jgi:hypothetical protein